MGCATVKKFPNLQINSRDQSDEPNENKNQLFVLRNGESLFIIREESARYEDSAHPSRAPSLFPNN